MRRLEAAGVTRFRMNVRADNPGAHRLYERLGWRHAGDEDGERVYRLEL